MVAALLPAALGACVAEDLEPEATLRDEAPLALSFCSWSPPAPDVSQAIGDGFVAQSPNVNYYFGPEGRYVVEARDVLGRSVGLVARPVDLPTTKEACERTALNYAIYGIVPGQLCWGTGGGGFGGVWKAPAPGAPGPSSCELALRFPPELRPETRLRLGVAVFEDSPTWGRVPRRVSVEYVTND